jgi:alkylation response protein AidB-like acyl-CoA dehydrogenase
VDFDWTEEQLSFRDSVARFATEQLGQEMRRRDADHEFSRDEWQRCAEFGIQGLPVPVEMGGAGADPLTIALALETLGQHCTDNGLLFSMGAHMWSCEMPLVTFGSDEQRQRWLPGLCDGSLIGVQAMTEPESGSDAFALTTTATPKGDDYVLQGAKTFITNAPVADLFIIFATLGRDRGIGDLCAFVVERDAPGLSVGSPFRKMGLRTSPMSEVVLDGCRVPASHRLGSEGSGMAIFNHSMDWERTFILATAVGTMQRQLDRSVSYARERRQYGQPISSFQAVSHRLVDMRVRLDAARLLLYHLAWLRSKGRRTHLESAAAKLFLSESFLSSSLDAVQVHGALGFMEEAELERDVRDAVAGRIYSGTSDIQRNIIASRMGL